MRGYKELAQKIVNMLSKKMGHYSVRNHTLVIRFAVSVTDYNPTEYYNKLIDYADKKLSGLEV